MDNLESQNDNIHSKLKELLESNREIRKEMASLGLITPSSSSSGKRENDPSQLKSDVPQLQQMHNQASTKTQTNQSNNQAKKN